MAKRTKQELKALITDPDQRDLIDTVFAHENDNGNPHNVTADQVGALRKSDIKAGKNIKIEPEGRGIRVSCDITEKAVYVGGGGSSSGGSSSLTAENVGSGAGVFKELADDTLSFKSVTAGSNKLGITENTNDIELDVNQANIDHDQLSNFSANEHVDHSTVSITAGSGLTGGGTIAQTRTLSVDINGQTQATAAEGDEVLIVDASASNALRKATTLSIAELATPKLTGTTTGATSVDLVSDITGAQISIASNKVYTFCAWVTGKQTGGSAGTTYDAWSYKVEGCISNVGGTTALQGAPQKTVFYEAAAACDCVAEADDTNDYLTIKCTGDTNRNIYWQAKVILTGGI